MNVLKNLLKIIFAFVFSIIISAYHFFVLGFFVSSAKKGILYQRFHIST